MCIATFATCCNMWLMKETGKDRLKKKWISIVAAGSAEMARGENLGHGARYVGDNPQEFCAGPITACMTFALQRFFPLPLIGPGLFVELACCSQLREAQKLERRSGFSCQLCSLLQRPGPIPTFADAGRQGLCSRVVPIGCTINLIARRGWRTAEFTSLCSPDSPSKQLTARIVQDAAVQRAMTSGGCGMDARSHGPICHAAHTLLILSLGARESRCFCCLFRQRSQGHPSVHCFVLVALHVCGSAGFEFRIATHVPVPAPRASIRLALSSLPSNRPLCTVCVYSRGTTHSPWGMNDSQSFTVFW